MEYVSGSWCAFLKLCSVYKAKLLRVSEGFIYMYSQWKDKQKNYIYVFVAAGEKGQTEKIHCIVYILRVCVDTF